MWAIEHGLEPCMLSFMSYHLFQMFVSNMHQNECFQLFKFDFSKVLWGGAHQATSPDPFPVFSRASYFAFGSGFGHSMGILQINLIIVCSFCHGFLSRYIIHILKTGSNEFIGYVLFPICTSIVGRGSRRSRAQFGQHWLLIVADMTEKVVSVLNPVQNKDICDV